MHFLKEIILFICVMYVLSEHTSCSYNSRRREESSNHTMGRRIKRGLPDPASCYCSLLINEINTDSPNPAPSLFIELMRVYTTNTKHRKKPSNLLTDQFIVILRASPLAVVFYADLTDERLHLRNQAEVFVLGDPGLPSLSNTGISLSNPAIRSIFKNPDHPRLLPTGDDSPYAILLINGASRRRDITWMSLDQNANGIYAERKFSPAMISRFKPLIRDMVVYGKKVHASTCTPFDEIWPSGFEQEDGKTYILRDWDVDRRPDYSINRCSSNKLPYQIQSFQYDSPSPGLPNPCKGVSFIIEEIIDKIAPLSGTNNEDVNMCSADYPGIPSGRYSSIQEEALADYRENAVPGNCELCDTGSSSMAQEAMNIAINNGDIVRHGGIPVLIDSIGHMAGYSQDMIDLATPYLPENGALMYRKDIQQWLRVIRPSTGERPITFQCSICIQRYGDKMADVKRKEDIMTPNGYFSTNVYSNARKIKKHAESVTHKDAVESAYKLAEATSDQERHKIIHEYQHKFNQDLLPTVNMIRTVYAEALAEVPFMYHPVLVDMEQSNGVDLGSHHYHKSAATYIMKSISDTMHVTLLESLVKNDLRFSLIVDTTTSNMNVPYLICYFQLTEDGYPVTLYYRNIDLSDGETALATFNSFWDAVIKDDKLVPGFLQYFKTRLTFFVSDNASVMIGKNLSLLSFLKEKLGRNIVNIGCMAHKASLALKAAIRDTANSQLEFIKTFESNLNELYIFYMSRGSKRLQHLIDTALEFGVHLIRFRKNIEVRWAAGEYTCIHAITNNLRAVREDLLQIQVENSFTEAAKKQAENVYKTVTDLPTVLLYYEFMDFLEINKLLAEKFQERSGLLLDHYTLIQRSIQDYRNLAVSPGKSLSNFLSGCVCPEVCTIPDCTLADIEKCSNPLCDDNISLQKYFDPNFKLSEARVIMYQNLLQSLSNYFSLDLVNALVVFDNREFFTETDPRTKMNNFKFVCNFFDIEESKCNQIGLSYFSLVEQLQQDPTYSRNFKSQPSLFWPMVLQNNGDTLQISTELRDFMMILMVLSDSSAEAERGFSILTRLDSGGRSGFAPDTLDSLLRIKLNGNKPVSKIDAFRYAKRFVEAHHRVDDTTSGGRAKNINYVYQKRYSRLF